MSTRDRWPHLKCGCRANLTQQVRIIRRAEANIVRKDRCTIDVAVTVHGIRSPDGRYRRQASRRLHRGIVKRVGGSKPIAGGGPLVLVRCGSAAVQDRAKMVAADIGRGYGSQLRLDDLADLLFERHARHEVGDEGFDGRVERGRCRARPARRIAVAARESRHRHDGRKRGGHGDRQGSAFHLQRRRQESLSGVHSSNSCWSAAQTRCDEMLMVPLSVGTHLVALCPQPKR